MNNPPPIDVKTGVCPSKVTIQVPEPSVIPVKPVTRWCKKTASVNYRFTGVVQNKNGGQRMSKS